MKALMVAWAMTLSTTLMAATASDLGWRHIDFKGTNSTEFSVDVRLVGVSYSKGQVYNADVWVHVSDANVTEAKAVVLNYFRDEQPAVVKEFHLTYNKAAGVFEGPVPYGLDVGGSNGYVLAPSRQEIAVRINGSEWLKTSDNQSNFRFNIFEIFNVQI